MTEAPDNNAVIRDRAVAEANELRQSVAELRQMLALAIHGPLGPESLDQARKLLERSAK